MLRVLESAVSRNQRQVAEPATESSMGRATQFLALIDPREESVFGALLEAGVMRVEELVNDLGLDRAFRFANRLGWAGFVLVDGPILRVTPTAERLKEAVLTATLETAE